MIKVTKENRRTAILEGKASPRANKNGMRKSHQSLSVSVSFCPESDADERLSKIARILLTHKDAV